MAYGMMVRGAGDGLEQWLVRGRGGAVVRALPMLTRWGVLRSAAAANHPAAGRHGHEPGQGAAHQQHQRLHGGG